MGLELSYDYGATPLSADELAELIPGHITTLGELNQWEQENILKSRQWLFSRRRKNILDLGFLLQLHRQMFSHTWKWAGRFRLSEKNLGV